MWILCITHPECGSTWLTCVADQNDFEHHIPCFLPRHSHPDACIRARESNAVRTRNSQRRIACTDAADRRGANEPTSRLYDRRGRAWPGLFAVFSTSTPRFWGPVHRGSVDLWRLPASPANQPLRPRRDALAEASRERRARGRWAEGARTREARADTGMQAAGRAALRLLGQGRGVEADGQRLPAGSASTSSGAASSWIR